MNKINNLQRPSIEETISCIKNIQSLNLIDTDIGTTADELPVIGATGKALGVESIDEDNNELYQLIPLE